MILLDKIKEAAISVIPVMILVWLLHLTIAPLGENLPKFITGGILLILGLGVFLLGAEVGVVPIGQRAGSTLTQLRNLPVLLCSGLFIGFFITVAEPDVHVLAQQVSAVAPALGAWTLVLSIAAGVGIFVSLAIARIVFQISLRLLLVLLYLLVLLVACFAPQEFLGVAFDAGGATTGPMTVPFIMALGVGVATVRAGNRDADSFGLIGIASVGPVLAMLVLGLFQSSTAAPAETETTIMAGSLWGHFLRHVPEVAREVALALSPLVALFAIFRIFLLRRMTNYRLLRTCMGLVYTYLGLVCFFVGVKGGFIPAGASLGRLLANSSHLLLATAFALGALAVFAEPAVWVLTRQVEEVSGGAIPGKVILVFLCIGVAIAVALALFRLTMGLPLWMFLLPGYLLAFGLTIFCPPMFTAIAFDSGGVASGPMASTFILAFTLGAAGEAGGTTMDAFGAIALIAMTPLIAIQFLGMLYGHSARKKKNHGAKK